MKVSDTLNHCGTHTCGHTTQMFRKKTSGLGTLARRPALEVNRTQAVIRYNQKNSSGERWGCYMRDLYMRVPAVLHCTSASKMAVAGDWSATCIPAGLPYIHHGSVREREKLLLTDAVRFRTGNQAPRFVQSCCAHAHSLHMSLLCMLCKHDTVSGFLISGG